MSEQPCQSDFCGRRALLLCDLSKKIDEGLIGFPGFGREPKLAAEVRRGKEALTQRTVGDHANPKFFQCRQDLRFRLTPPERILTLQRGDRLDRIGASD